MERRHLGDGDGKAAAVCFDQRAGSSPAIVVLADWAVNRESRLSLVRSLQPWSRTGAGPDARSRLRPHDRARLARLQVGLSRLHEEEYETCREPLHRS